MNLKLKATLLWVLALIGSTLVVFMLFAVVWLILAYPGIVFSIAMGVFMIYVLISAWVSIYYHVKSKEANKMLKFKEGQTYICTKSEAPWWTEGKEYQVRLCVDGDLYLIDDDCDAYNDAYINTLETKFKLLTK